jgi:IS30 family transposase
MQHRELSYPERQYLELRLLGNWSPRLIAEKMVRDHGALSREVRGNRCADGRYRAKEAQRAAERNTSLSLNALMNSDACLAVGMANS